MTELDIAFAPITELSRRLASGELSARALTELFITRAERLNPACRAFIELTADDARRAATACDGSHRVGPLWGIPFACKDLIDVAGVRTTAGSRVLADNLARTDAHLVACMRAAGAISLGKLNLHEFAYGATGENPVFGTAVNAYDPARLAGGSSSGSAAAVAYGLVPAAFGTDTGGSVRVPAALSGLVGLKPTLGRISTRGVIPYSWSLDHVGTITRTVEDAALLLGTVAGFDPADPASAREPAGGYRDVFAAPPDIAGLRIGVPRKFYYDRADPEILAAAEAVLRHLESRGARLTEVDLPSMDTARTVSLTIQMPEALSFHMRYLDERADLYGEDFRAGLALGQSLLAEHYVRAKRVQAVYRQQMDAVFDRVDLIVTPATPMVAPKIGTTSITFDGIDEAIGDALTRYTTFFNMSGHPAISVPAGAHSSGLPMSVQLVARYFEEPVLFEAAATVENCDLFSLPLPNVG